ncbi:hypothetical protein GGP41_006497 [Bipolaris sorokiniana]|uniref:CHAT domain-containing protein n=1 Tax=Cochliobolus sativus TaxID=45130 RepID=A0A8H5ZR71_COCSA|nr:hypothetical protein GGP41_006497 [Bipolaris sorokiniana]
MTDMMRSLIHYSNASTPDSFSGPSVIRSRFWGHVLAFVATETSSVVEKVSQTLNAAFLAYLSACSTGPNNNTSTLLVDENIHHISSFRLAGFRHIVGTLWDVQDEYCVDTARVFYGTLRDEGISDDAVTTIDVSQTVNETSIDLVGVNKASITSDVRTAKLVNRLAKQENRLHPRYWAP